MNIERLTYIAEWLEAGAPHRDGAGFNMNRWHNPADEGEVETDFGGASCGTAMCIGGATMQFFGGVPASQYVDWTRESIRSAASLLGLTDFEARWLFFPDNQVPDIKYSAITASDAAKVIRHLIETGEVDWGIVE